MTAAEVTRAVGDHALSGIAGVAEAVAGAVTAVVMIGIVVVSQVVRSILVARERHRVLATRR